MSNISMSKNFENEKTAGSAAHVFIENDPEFVGVPNPSEQEAAADIQKRIQELREFIQGQ